jgi:hypothetical protein
MREEELPVFRFVMLAMLGERPFHLARLPRDDAVEASRRELLFQHTGGQACIFSVVPFDHHRIESAFGRPGMVTDHCNRSLETHDLPHTGYLVRIAVIDLLHTAADHRTHD